MVFGASLSGSDKFFVFVSQMETVLYLQMFYSIFQFCSKVKFATLDGNIANWWHSGIAHLYIILHTPEWTFLTKKVKIISFFFQHLTFFLSNTETTVYIRHCVSKVEGCIGFWIPRDPTQISREQAVLSLLRAGVGGQKISLETRGERWDLACNRNGVNTRSWEEN